ncbi:helix-turn-helix domain-containing protein, partial [Brevibacillus laterosporus]|nr:helix-turn-helix domain-containing protein [Brevibacillus laterosporus]
MHRAYKFRLYPNRE